jgi:hypothetical protein
MMVKLNNVRELSVTKDIRTTSSRRTAKLSMTARFPAISYGEVGDGGQVAILCGRREDCLKSMYVSRWWTESCLVSEDVVI